MRGGPSRPTGTEDAPISQLASQAATNFQDDMQTGRRTELVRTTTSVVFTALLCQSAQALDGSSDSTSVQSQQSSEDATAEPETASTSNDGASRTSVIVIAVGFVVLTGLAFFLVTVYRSRKNQTDRDQQASNPPSDAPRAKRKTFVVPDIDCTRIDIEDSTHSLVPVLGDDKSHLKTREPPELEADTSWAEASAASSSYSIAPLSSRHRIPAVPSRIYAPARGFNPGNSQASDFSSHTDDYSIGMLESPVSTEYSFGSEEDDIFPSTPWDDVDSYRSMDFTFLSTTSSNVFDSNSGRNDSSWKQVNRPNGMAAIGSTLPSAPLGVLFVRQLDSHQTGRMCLDPRGRGTRNTNRMRFDIEV
ncbi:hypothetical protein PHYBOEH_003458 [Phytophthora boehmeriae]|uniref:Uncharacterized protein n=1 Tax=Phytophthora boehmeriae TaxID=109152 RepID=A0A8T1WSJ2_9STRA|nr:hypothetical protein PHYBOEH_003458 [Phytophthora boehmeriae]